MILKRALQFLVSLGLMALFLYWAFKGTDPGALWGAVRQISLPWVVVLLVITCVTVQLRAWRWQLLMRPFAPGVSNWDASLALVICYAANIAIPRSGEALRALSLNWTRGLPVTSVVATVVVERILDLVWLIIFVGISLLLLRGRLDDAFPLLAPLSLLALVGCIFLLAALVLTSLYRERALVLVEGILSRISRPLAAKVCGLLETFTHGLEALHSPAVYAEIVLSSSLLNLGYALIIYASFSCFAETTGLGLGASVVIMTLSSVGVIIPTAASAGPYHFLFSQGLHQLYGIPEAPALACATVTHALATLFYLVVGGPALWLQWRRHKDRA
ncbi:MAG: flippase-like domain-containing protein [Candidatus Latescibacteria bacterium]|nr:flippase-like domain-containing protein [Candidatus Latescibacterota bacterium]